MQIFKRGSQHFLRNYRLQKHILVKYAGDKLIGFRKGII